MQSEGYDAFDDPYAYRGTRVLKNKLGLRDGELLESFELEMSTLRAGEALPSGKFDPAHYKRVHRHLFQDVYSWAGKYRTVRTAKAGNMFCYPEHIESSMDRLFAAFSDAEEIRKNNPDQFVANTATFLSDLNAVHPFREGNGRCQLTFVAMLGRRAGLPFDFAKVERRTFLPAMIASFAGELAPLQEALRELLIISTDT